MGHGISALCVGSSLWWQVKLLGDVSGRPRWERGLVGDFGMISRLRLLWIIPIRVLDNLFVFLGGLGVFFLGFSWIISRLRNVGRKWCEKGVFCVWVVASLSAATSCFFSYYT